MKNINVETKIEIKVTGFMGLTEKKMRVSTSEVERMVDILKTIQDCCTYDSAGHMEYFKHLCDIALKGIRI